jgi:NDP-sugar pyrophosphorylase family protein
MFENSVIIAGGIGSRMRPLTNYIPKAIVEINGTPLINNSIEFLSLYKINIFVTYNYLPNFIFEKINSSVSGFINTINQDNSYFLFNSFVKKFNEPIIVLPCDIKINIDLNEVYEDYLKKGEPSIMIVGTSPVNGVSGDYLEIDKNNNIISLSRTIKTRQYCSGLQIINPYKVNKLSEPYNNFYSVWNYLIEKKEIKLSGISPDFWNSYDEINQIK